MKKILQKPLLWLLFGAIATAFVLVFPILGVLQWITMIPIFLAIYKLGEDSRFRGKRAYFYGFFTVYAYYFILYHWFISLYPLDFVGLEIPAAIGVIAFAWLGLPLLQAIPGGLIFLFYRGIQKTGLFHKAPILRPFVFSALWVVFEWSSTLHWSGVPWGRLALGQVELLPMLQSASLLGSYFVSFLILLVNGLVAYAICFAAKRLLCACLAGGLLAANLGYGLISLAVSSKPEQAENAFCAAVIQPNIGSDEKWSDTKALTFDRCYDLSLRAAEEGARLIVMPETVFPYEIDGSLCNYLGALARECDAYVAVGAFYSDEKGDEYNALYLFTPEGELSEQVYGKRHLVPFGEYVPLRDLVTLVFPPLANISMLAEDLTPGKDSALFETELGKIGSLICFDSIYEQLTLDSVRDGAELMLISSNDSWFFDSAAVYQHQAQAQLRAIESGRYFVRSANTGISTIVAPDGEVLEKIDPLIDGYAVSVVQPKTDRTLYTVVGNLFVYLCIAFPAGLWITGEVLKRRGKREV